MNGKMLSLLSGVAMPLWVRAMPLRTVLHRECVVVLLPPGASGRAGNVEKYSSFAGDAD